MQTVEIAAPRYHPPRPAPLVAFAVDSRTFFTAMTPQTAQQAIDSGKPFTYLCMAEQSYLTLGAYFSEILRYVEQVNAVIDYYEEQD